MLSGHTNPATVAVPGDYTFLFLHMLLILFSYCYPLLFTSNKNCVFTEKVRCVLQIQKQSGNGVLENIHRRQNVQCDVMTIRVASH